MSNINNKANLKWYCMDWDSNYNKPYAENVLAYIDKEDMIKKIKYNGKKPDKYNSIKNWYELREYLKREFMYYLWSKAEHEILVNGLFDKAEYTQKIDVWAQIAPNLDEITNYVIAKMKLPFDIIDNPDEDKDLHFGLPIL